MRLFAAGILLALCAPGQTVVRKEKPFTIHVHFRDEAIALHAATIASATWELGQQFLRPEPKAVANARFEVHLYEDAALYHAAGERLRSPHHADAPAFADSRSASCHVMVETRDDLPGLPPTMQRLLAHECMHLAIYLSNPGAMFLPEWFAEGIPLWAEAEVIKGLPDIDTVDQGAMEVADPRIARDLVAAGTWPSLRSVLDGELASLDRRRRYVVFAHVSRFLAGRADLWPRLWSVSRQPFGPSMPVRLREEIAASTSGGLDAMDKELQTFMTTCLAEKPAPPAAKAKPPAGTRGAPDFVPPAPRSRWLARHEKPTLEIRANVQLQARGSPQADLVLAGGSRCCVRVTVYGGDGIRVSRRNDDGTWNELGVHLAPADVPTDTPVSIRVTANAGKLDVDLARNRVLSLAIPGFELRGLWGFGRAPGTRSLWSEVRIR